MYSYTAVRILKVTLDPTLNKTITTNNGATPFIHSTPNDINYKSLVVGKWLVIKTRGKEIMSIENVTNNKQKQTILGLIVRHIVNPTLIWVSIMLHYSGFKGLSKKLLASIS